MQYQIDFTLVKKKGSNVRWEEVDISNLTIKELFKEYKDLKMQLLHPTFEKDMYVELEDLRLVLTDELRTVSQSLQDVSEVNLNLREGKLNLVRCRVIVDDLWDAGYTMDRANISYHPELDISTSDKVDTLITKEGVDYKDLHEHTLVSLNGLFYRTSYSEFGMYVLDGSYPLAKGHTYAGLVSFENIGKIECVPFTEEMIYSTVETPQLYLRTNIDLGVNIEDKTVLLCIGGYLHILDNLYKVVGSSQIQIDFTKYPLIQRFIESYDLVDLSSLGVERDPVEVAKILNSNDYIKKLLTLSQSFAVIVDNVDVHLIKSLAESSGLPGVFYYPEEPKSPLVYNRGRFMPYKKYNGQAKWVMKGDSNLVDNFVFEHTDYEGQEFVSDRRYPFNPMFEDSAFLYDIGTDRITIS